jgi:tetratricopeptide (TPR) repeat protein
MPVSATMRTHYSKNPYYYYIMARVDIENGNLEEGIENYKKAIKLNKDDFTIARELLDIYYITGNYSEALNIAAGLYTKFYDERGIAEIYADILAKNDKFDRAIEIYEKLLKNNSSNNEIRLNLASLYQAEARDKEALRQYIKILKNNPENNFARISIGDIYLSMKKYSAAEEIYLESIKYGADIRDIYRQAALVNKYRGKRKKSLKYLQKIIQEYPEDLKTLLLLAEIYQDSHQLKKAEKVLKKVNELTDSNIGVLLRMGLLYTEMQEHDLAIQIFKEAVRKYPDDYNSWYFLGLAYEYAENYMEAEKTLLKALEIREEEQIYFHMGIIYDRMGLSQKAIDMFQKCLRINPGHASAHNYLGYTWAEKGVNLEMAEMHIRKALEIEPGNHAYTDSLGWVLYKQKRYEESVINLKKAASMTEDAVIYEHLGDAYLRISKKEKAIKTYKKALKLEPENKRIKKKLNEVSGN